MTTAACPFCEAEAPAADHRIGELGASVAYLHDDQFFPGWVVLVLKRHARELFELDAAERAAMMDDVVRVARVLDATFSPRKINYACLGNQVPHVHWHVVPRLSADPLPLEPVWAVPHAPLRLDAARLADRIGRLRAGLGV